MIRDQIFEYFLGPQVHESTYRKNRAMGFVQKNRVIWTSATRYIVESKRYPPAKKKPSRIHIINHLHDYNFQCDCDFVFGTTFDTCSHVLAVMLSICIRDNSVRMLEDREADRVNELNNYRDGVLVVNERGVPITGNEYPDHQKQKERIHNLFVEDLWEQGVEYEKEVHCFNPHTRVMYKHPYSLDVYAARYIEGKLFKVGIEINREEKGGGHGSKITGPKDRNRAQEIEDQHRIKVIQFNVSHLKAASDQDILREVYQKIGLAT